MFQNDFDKLAEQVGQVLKEKEWKIVTAESCTAGGLAYAMTSIPGSSTWFDRGFVTYSNLSKIELIDVNENIINEHGAVSEQTARAMADGALSHSQAQISMAVTGIAGPDGGSTLKPVGTVWFAISSIDKETTAYPKLFQGDRKAIREQSIQFALEKLLQYIKY